MRKANQLHNLIFNEETRKWECDDPCVKIETEEIEYDPAFIEAIGDCPLDPGIEDAVMLLQAHNVETFESCEGGEGHAFYQPTVRFHGSKSEGYRAFAIALENGLQVEGLCRVWDCIDGELVGPIWEITFVPESE